MKIEDQLITRSNRRVMTIKPSLNLGYRISGPEESRYVVWTPVVFTDLETTEVGRETVSEA